MRGANRIISFGFLGLVAMAMAWHVNRQPWFNWCGDKQGCLPRSVPTMAAAIDLDSLIALIGFGVVGLVAIVLLGNGLVRLSRSRRPHI